MPGSKREKKDDSGYPGACRFLRHSTEPFCGRDVVTLKAKRRQGFHRGRGGALGPSLGKAYGKTVFESSKTTD